MRLSVVNQVAGPLIRQLLEDLPAKGNRAGTAGRLGGPRRREICHSRGGRHARCEGARLAANLDVDAVHGQREWFLVRRRRRPARIVTNPPTTMLMASWLRRLLGLRYVLLVYDIYPDVLERMKMIRRGGLLSRLWRRWSRKAMLHASAVITLGPHMADTLRGHLRAGEGTWPSRSFPTGPTPMPSARSRRPPTPSPGSTGWSEARGDVQRRAGRNARTESIVAAAEMLQDLADVQFVIIGEGLAARPSRNSWRKKASRT